MALRGRPQSGRVWVAGWWTREQIVGTAVCCLTIWVLRSRPTPFAGNAFEVWLELLLLLLLSRHAGGNWSGRDGDGIEDSCAL